MADLHAVIAAAGWDGPVSVWDEHDPERVIVAFGGRRIEAVSIEAAILFIQSDTRARESAATLDAEVDDD